MRVVKLLLFGLSGSLLTAVIGYYLIFNFSGNRHDLELEAAMTAIFICAPLGFIAGIILRIILTRLLVSPSSSVNQ